jgi:hypothetical protein
MLDFFGPGLIDVFIDNVFELGVALLGAAATACLPGILLNRQQENAIKWRIEITKLIEESEKK